MLSIDELASELGWTRARVYRLVRTAQIPHAKIGGRICFLKSDVEAWIAQTFQRTRPMPVDRKVPAPALTREEECRRLGIPVDHMFAG